MQSVFNFLLYINDFHWGDSAFQWLFYAGILLTLIFEKQKVLRIVFGWAPLLYLLFTINPLTITLLKMAGVYNRLYFARLYSFMPLMVVIARGFSLLCRVEDERVKLVLMVLACAVICITGKNIYKESWLQEAENWSKTPGETFEILEALDMQSDRPVSVAAIDPINVYIRQVGDVVTPYGRYVDGLGAMLMADPPDVKRVMEAAGVADVDYIVAHRTDATLSAFADGGYVPVVLTDSYAVYGVGNVARTRRTLNEKRQIVAVTTYGADGQMIRTPDGYATITYAYNAKGDRIRETYLDEKGDRINIKEGYSTVERTYYPISHRTQTVSYLDATEQLTLVSGCYKTRFAYDSSGRVVGEAYLDQEGRPMDRTDTGYAFRQIRYDNNRRKLGEAYLDVEGKPVKNADGYASYELVWDENNHIVKELFYNEQSSLTLIADGYAIETRDYDAAGNVICVRYYDTNGEPVAIRKGYAEVRRKYDKASRIIRESYWDTEGNPISRPEGFHGYKKKYNSEGDVVSVKYFDEDGKSVKLD